MSKPLEFTCDGVIDCKSLHCKEEMKNKNPNITINNQIETKGKNSSNVQIYCQTFFPQTQLFGCFVTSNLFTISCENRIYHFIMLLRTIMMKIKHVIRNFLFSILKLNLKQR